MKSITTATASVEGFVGAVGATPLVSHLCLSSCAHKIDSTR
jgi:hypothetical protein